MRILLTYSIILFILTITAVRQQSTFLTKYNSNLDFIELDLSDNADEDKLDLFYFVQTFFRLVTSFLGFVFLIIPYPLELIKLVNSSVNRLYLAHSPPLFK